MDDEPGTSKETNEQLQQGGIKHWTRELKSIPPFTYELMQKHLIGYQLFKDKYVKQVMVKADVKKENEQLFYIVKGCVRKANYVVYIHVNQVTGEIAYANCTCKAGKVGCCAHVVALLFQIIECIQMDFKAIPDDITCTQLLQQWHVPKNNELKEPILYEDVVFERASYEKDDSGKKRKKSKTCNDISNPCSTRVFKKCNKRKD